MSYQLFRKHALPDTEQLVAKSFYIVSEDGSNKASLYYTTADKTVKAFLNEERVQEMLQGVQGQTLYTVESIEERDLLRPTKDSLVVVTGDLSEDPEPIPMLFLYVASLSRFIGMSGTHTHSNLPVLNGIAEGAEERLMYKGKFTANVLLAGSEW